MSKLWTPERPVGVRTARVATPDETARFGRRGCLERGLMPAMGGGGSGYYELGVRTGSLTAAGNYADLRTGSGIRARVVEIGVSMGVAGASPTIGLSRETVVGTASTSAAPQPEETADPAATAVVGTAWSGAPTVSANYLRRITLPATLGAGWVWAWPEANPLIVPVSLGLMVSLIAISAATATALDVYFRYLE